MKGTNMTKLIRFLMPGLFCLKKNGKFDRIKRAIRGCVICINV